MTDTTTTAAPHATLVKFGYPASEVVRHAHWTVLLRPQQVTLGSLVICSLHEANSLGALPPEAFAELHAVVSGLEAGLRRFRPYDKINYLALMMVDPQVHFHVIPRYAASQSFGGITLTDAAWPGPPDLKSATTLPPAVQDDLHRALVDSFGFSG